MERRAILVPAFLIALFWSSCPATASAAPTASGPAPFTASVQGEPQQEDKSGLPQRQLSEKERKERERRLKKELETVYKKWLNEDVSYVIADEERKAFLALETEEEREQFIEQFWLRRDPTPDTPENEFKEEHYRRIAYANERFASGIPGWKADRGKIYIIWGPADEIESHPSGGSYDRPPEEGGGSTSTYPFEKWRYRYLEGIGNDVILEFVDPSMSGEYRLTMDPSEKDALLMVPGAGLTQLEAMGMASKTDRFTRTDGTRLGKALGGTPVRMGQFERLELFAKIQRPPQVKFKDLEAIVSTRISYNLLPFDLRQDFIRITEDTVMVPLTIRIENDKMTFQQKEGLYSATVNVFGRVTSVGGRVVQTFEDVIAQHVPESLYRQAIRQRSMYQKTVLLRPGLYRLDLVLKDLNSGNVGTLNTRLAVPRFEEEKLSASSLILADLIEKVPLRMVGTGPFVIGGTKVRPSVGEQFEPSERLGIYMQVYNLGVDETSHKPSATVEYRVWQGDKEVFQYTEKTEQMERASSQVTLEKVLPLEQFAPGHYKLEIKVTDNLAKRAITPTADFTVVKK